MAALVTPDASNTVIFNSETAVSNYMPTATLGGNFPNVTVANGTLNVDYGDGNWMHAGTTFTIGDGDTNTLAQVNAAG